MMINSKLRTKSNEPQINLIDKGLRPPILQGLSRLELQLFFTDGLMTPEERNWYNRRCMTKALMLSPKNGWIL